MSWADLDWPDLSPTFPEPHHTTPVPARPEVPSNIAARVQRDERRRGIFVPICVAAGGAVFCAGLAVHGTSPRDAGTPDPTALVLLAAGLIVATLVPALAVLWVIGPTWSERQQHLALLHWEREQSLWLTRERHIYIYSLPNEDRERFQRACATAPR